MLTVNNHGAEVDLFKQLIHRLSRSKILLFLKFFPCILITCRNELFNPKRKNEKELVASVSGCVLLVVEILLKNGALKKESV